MAEGGRTRNRFKNAGRGAVNNYIICDQAVSETDNTRDTMIIIYFFLRGGRAVDYDYL